MKPPAVLPAVLLAVLLAVLCLGALGACAEDPAPEGAAAISQQDLQAQVAEMYPPKTAETTVEVECDGGLAAERDAGQDCRVRVRKRVAHVRVRVVEVTGSDASIDAVPFVEADRVAEELLASLTAEGYHVREVVCPGELLGTVGRQVTCTATPNTGTGDVIASVTKVHGLRIEFDYEVVA